MSKEPANLAAFITGEIEKFGPISFSRYMELCLYHPEMGYYAADQERFGRTGDFYTSSDVHAVFGRLLAVQFEEMWRALGKPQRFDIVELGPGRGLFARDVLDWLQQHFPQCHNALHYCLVENSPSLARKLGERLRDQISAGKASLHHEFSTGLCRHPVIIFANEFFDALPVEVVTSGGELRIGLPENLPGYLGAGASSGRETWTEQFVPPSPAVIEYIARHSVEPEGDERIEVGLVAHQWMANLASSVDVGFLIVIDYGFLREEQQRGRHRGTLTCFRQHTVRNSPYQSPGEQDITSHVNFTALQDAAAAGGMTPVALVTQAQFLMGIGEADQFAGVFQHAGLPQERVKTALQLKHLISPEGMGESFRVLLLGKGVEPEKAARLSGAAFNRRVASDQAGVRRQNVSSPLDLLTYKDYPHDPPCGRNDTQVRFNSGVAFVLGVLWVHLWN